MSSPSNASYGEATAGLHKLAERVCQALEDLLSDRVVLHSIDSRVKSQTSADRKLLLHPERYKSYADVHDMLGIRVITLFESDLDAAAAEICRIIDSDPSRSGDKAEQHSPDQFGYSSRHFVGTLSSTRGQLPEFARFQGQVIEVQLRTVLQHAWAEIEHDLGYKPQRPISTSLRRRFSQLAALIELADGQFAQLRNEIEAREAAAEEASGQAKNQTDRTIDVAELTAFIHDNDTIALLDNTIAAAFDRALLPEGKNYRAFVGEVADLCGSIGWTSIDQISTALEKYAEPLKTWARMQSSHKAGLDGPTGVMRPGFTLIHLIRMIAEGDVPE